MTLELEPKHAAVARENVARAGHASTVEIRVGPAAESLRTLAAERAEPFDFVADNTVRDGKIADAGSADPDVQAVRQFHEMIAKNARLSGTAIQTVGSKGYDGFTMAVVQ